MMQTTVIILLTLNINNIFNNNYLFLQLYGKCKSKIFECN